MALPTALKGASFVKYSSFGNDFLILTDDQRLVGEQQPGEVARRYCSRHYGVGADGLLSWQRMGDASFRLRIFNADGSEASMCGNGLRAWASWWFTLGGVGDRYDLQAEGAKQVEVVTLAGRFGVTARWSALLMPGAQSAADKVLLEGVGIRWAYIPKFKRHYTGQLGQVEYAVEDWDSGVPHALLWVDALPDNWLELSEQLAKSKYYADGDQEIGAAQKGTNDSCKTNVDWVVASSDGRLNLYTFERGVGHTLACGTGSVAAAASYLTKNHALVADASDRSAVKICYSGLVHAMVTAKWCGQDLWLYGPPAQAICQGILL